MKKAFLLLSILGTSFGSFAQFAAFSKGPMPTIDNKGRAVAVNSSKLATYTNPLAKTTSTTDTVTGIIPDGILNDISDSTFQLYPAATDSGYIFGTNVFGTIGFAQRYDFDGADSSVQVIGLLAAFGGTYTPNTTKTITFNCWSQGAPALVSPSDPNFFYSGLPNASVAQTSSISIANLGIGLNGQPNSVQSYLFNAPSPIIDTSFFVGFELAYTPTALNGDTIAVLTSDNGSRAAAQILTSGSDTLENDWNTVELVAGQWQDAQLALGAELDYYLIPIMVSTKYVGVKGVTRNNLAWYGNYPNPANNVTNIKFSLNKTADVTVTITDMTGRNIDVVTQSNLGAGTHEIVYNTSKLAAGNYLYIIRTNTGDAMASKLTVVR